MMLAEPRKELMAEPLNNSSKPKKTKSSCNVMMMEMVLLQGGSSCKPKKKKKQLQHETGPNRSEDLMVHTAITTTAMRVNRRERR